MNTMCSMISAMVCSVPHFQRVFSHLTVFSVGYSRLARLYVRLRSGQLFNFLHERLRVLRKVKYPAYDAFVANVKLEAEQNVQRLRHHPSIVIFAGNNEGLAPLSESEDQRGT
jgi:hypothetical protein